MPENIPLYVPLTFVLTTALTLFMFYSALKNSEVENFRRKSGAISAALVLWLAIQAVIALKGIYYDTIGSFPPLFLISGVLPALLTILLLFVTKGGRKFADSMPLRSVTYINIVRIPVELVLYWLFLHRAVPELMTFAGRNFDILAGISAPFVAYFGFTKNFLGRRFILIWNIICLGLLFNIVINAFLSAPTPLQRFAFDMPNVAILFFPYIWLPTFIVPVVLLGHIISIRKLITVK